ncbi:MAG TPA: phosphoglycerate dehydrogenase [Gammaproteobacteria bacterium]|nr:phosphoglycerate dehydrogenase [Gammaproteobacteria bacterium]
MHKILVLNNISPLGLGRLPKERYEVDTDIDQPDAILVRSHKMHDMEIPGSLKAVGRAGAGVNNIPVDEMSRRGIPVFNAPGANANAVKELVIAGMLLAARNIPEALEYAGGLTGSDDEIHQAVESGKKKFRGFELPRRTLGVVGLGAIGVKVANAAMALGMNVVGYDPKLTVGRAWELHSGVQSAMSVDELLGRADFLTFHVPLNDETRGMLSAKRLQSARDGLVVLNFARDGIVDADVICDALDGGKVHAYVCDFPGKRLLGHRKVIALPHLGASTREAEENCAVMVADQVREYLEKGNVSNSVNFPEAIMPRGEGYRLCIVNANVPNMLGQISTHLAQADLNIVDMLNKSRDKLAYTLVDVDSPVPEKVLDGIRGIEGVLSLRIL